MFEILYYKKIKISKKEILPSSSKVHFTVTNQPINIENLFPYPIQFLITMAHIDILTNLLRIENSCLYFFFSFFSILFAEDTILPVESSNPTAFNDPTIPVNNASA